MTLSRYFYFKNGDVVAQMNRIHALQGVVPDGGPDAFLADMLSNQQVGTVLLCSYAAADARAEFGHVSVKTLSQRTNPQKLLNLFRLLLAITAYRPQRILCGRAGAALATCLFAGRLLGVPVVFSAHTGVAGQRVGSLAALGDRFDAWLIRHCHAAICHGPYLEQQLLATGVAQQRIFSFDSGCRDLAGEEQDAPVPPTGPPRILYLGRMIRGKGILDLLNAFSTLISSGVDAYLDFAGDGVDLALIKEQARVLKITDKVNFLGVLEHAEVAGAIRRAWVVVTPTRRELPEGRCMTAMEALAMGVPVVAPNAGPFPFLVKDGVNGLLFAQDSVPELTSALKRLATEPELRTVLADQAFRDRHQLMEPKLRFGAAQSKAFEAA